MAVALVLSAVSDGAVALALFSSIVGITTLEFYLLLTLDKTIMVYYYTIFC
jgi:hypothetical protein